HYVRKFFRAGGVQRGMPSDADRSRVLRRARDCPLVAEWPAGRSPDVCARSAVPADPRSAGGRILEDQCGRLARPLHMSAAHDEVAGRRTERRLRWMELPCLLAVFSMGATAAEPVVAPYGSWHSPVSARLVAEAGTVLGGGRSELKARDGHLYWVERLATDGGRGVIRRLGPDGEIETVIGAPYDVGSAVHEYGGGAFALRGAEIIFSNRTDGRLYLQRPPEGIPEPLTPPGPWRYADCDARASSEWIICVREEHSPGAHPTNVLVAISATKRAPVLVVFDGTDFVSSPRISPDGSELAWIAWNHPHMPWDSSTLWRATLRPDGHVERARSMGAGATAEAFLQPSWSPDGRLVFLSDRTGWWNFYCWGEADSAELLWADSSDFGRVPWFFGDRDYVLLTASDAVAITKRNGVEALVHIDLHAQRARTVSTHEAGFHHLAVTHDGVAVFATSRTAGEGLLQWDSALAQPFWRLPPASSGLDARYISVAEPLTFPTTDGQQAHGYYYAPLNPDYVAPQGERPPLLVHVHGGPTASMSSALSLAIQFWTTRGFAVLDLNYRGSSGYGRAYRRAL